MKKFTHIKPHYAKSQLDEMAIYACLLANGTNLSIIKMSNLCETKRKLQVTLVFSINHVLHAEYFDCGYVDEFLFFLLQAAEFQLQ
ncbi:MAG: Tn3 family transposase [Gammaproteobacteria bacterium]|nr:Tn3 family transposase [Gammaproteobacteria bacterium]MCW5584191.1 Tn3 family transposase [Gammaproteobacteria bacterium]